MKKKGSDSSLIDGKAKIQIGFVVIGGLFLMLLKGFFKVLLVIGLAPLGYGLFLLFSKDGSATSYLLIGCGIVIFCILMLKLLHYFETKGEKEPM